MLNAHFYWVVQMDSTPHERNVDLNSIEGYQSTARRVISDVKSTQVTGSACAETDHWRYGGHLFILPTCMPQGMVAVANENQCVRVSRPDVRVPVQIMNWQNLHHKYPRERGFLMLHTKLLCTPTINYYESIRLEPKNSYIAR